MFINARFGLSESAPVAVKNPEDLPLTADDEVLHPRRSSLSGPATAVTSPVDANRQPYS